MAPKEDSEISTIKKACQATMNLFSKYVKEQITEIVDAEKVIKIHQEQISEMKK